MPKLAADAAGGFREARRQRTGHLVDAGSEVSGATDVLGGASGRAGAEGVGEGAWLPAVGVEPLARPARSRSIFRTRSSTPNGLNITSSERTSAARACTVPLSIPEMRSTGVALIAAWLRTY